MKRAFVLIAIFLTATVVFAQQKHALVIGNSNYTGIGSLNNPINDANDMKAVLVDLGFNVDIVLNGNLEEMENAVINLKRRLSGNRNSYGFFFYAGHGVQSNGENYLIPIQADNIQNDTHLRQRAVSLQFIMESLSEAGNELNMIVLDACRDNPFGWNRSGTRGLSVVSRAPTGTIIMYATAANSVAQDGTGRNGLFTGQLLNSLRTPGLNVIDMFRKTGEEVIRVSNGRQHPEISVRFFGTAYLGTRANPTPQPSPSPNSNPTPSPSPVPAPSIPANMVRINGGTFTMGSPISEPNRRNDETQRQIMISSFYMGKYEVTQREYENIMGYNPSHFRGADLPVENVTWFDVIEYCNRRSQREGLVPAYTMTNRTPVNGYPITSATVIWNRNANGYRLPTEAEWEYACRAGTTTAFNTGRNYISNDEITQEANFNARQTVWDGQRSVEVGIFFNRSTNVGNYPANAWGLHDIHGNVWEWVWDRHTPYSNTPQTDSTGVSSGTFFRVLRGGSWAKEGQFARSAFRHMLTAGSRVNEVGFRVVRNVPGVTYTPAEVR